MRSFNFVSRILRRLRQPSRSISPSAPSLPTHLPTTLTQPFVFTKVSGGLCNQLMCYAAAHRIAEIRNCPIFAYTSNFHATDHTRWMLDVYPHQIMIATDWVDFIQTLAIPAPFLPYDVLFDKEDKPISSHEFDALESQLLTQHISVIDFNLALYYFRSDTERYRPNLGLRCQLTPKREYLSDYTKELEKELAIEENPVAVHVRRGDFLDPSNDLEIRPEYYLAAIDLIRSRFPDSSFYVFSDDLNWCKTTFRKYENLTIVNTPSQYSAIEDLYLASRCQHFILSNHSTFSHWMTELRLRRERNLIITNSQKWLNTSRKINWYYTPQHCTVI